MHKLRLKKQLAFVAAILISFTMVGSSWAYWSQELLTANEYRLATYETDIVEVFESPNGWLPGIDINKDVSISNDGTVPVFVKIVLNQKWVRLHDVYDPDGNVIAPAAGEEFPLVFHADGNREYASIIHWGSRVVLLESGRTSVSSLRLDLPVVRRVSEAEGNWLLLNETPDENGDYILYYIGTLDGESESPLIIDSVEMNGKINASMVAERTIWDEQNQQWVTTYTNNPSHSYENARYTLTVTMHTVQATEDALHETFPADGTAEQSVITGLADFAFDPQDFNYSYNDNVALHKLYFDEVDGTMRYTPVRNGNENWFMSDLNMVPGGAYDHTLVIENRSNKGYDLYMQAIPLDQEREQDDVLRYIAMKVYYAGTLIYDGTAMGERSINSISNLQNVVYLGNYQPRAENELYVELVLDKDTPIEYAGILTNIDWKFMVEETAVVVTPSPSPSPTPGSTPKPGSTPTPGPKTSPSPSNPTGPKTGDDGPGGLWYILIMGIGGVCLIACVVFLLKTRDEDEFDFEAPLR